MYPLKVDNFNTPMVSAREDLFDYRFRYFNLYKTSLKILGFSKFISLFIYGLLFSYACSPTVTPYNTIIVSNLRVILLLAFIPVSIYGSVLLYAAIKENARAVNISLGLCLFMGIFDLVVGGLGVNTYSRHMEKTVNTILVYSYFCLSLDMFWVLCNDLPHLLMYRRVLEMAEFPRTRKPIP